jgi:hypothetical protein
MWIAKHFKVRVKWEYEDVVRQLVLGCGQARFVLFR